MVAGDVTAQDSGSGIEEERLLLRIAEGRPAAKRRWPAHGVSGGGGGAWTDAWLWSRDVRQGVGFGK